MGLYKREGDRRVPNRVGVVEFRLGIHTGCRGLVSQSTLSSLPNIWGPSIQVLVLGSMYL